ncbi:MAG TPA: aspartate kinase [Nitrososphaerales archaeon]|nr:aspartate kinase [Nitrososphaerales archaeon]
MKLVMKFGGSLLAGDRGINRVVRIVKAAARGNKVVVVVSAIGDTTEILLDAAEASKSWDSSRIDSVMTRIGRIHTHALRGSGLGGEELKAVLTTSEELLENLKLTLTGVSILGELSPRSVDLIVSYGERLAAPIVAAALVSSGVTSVALTGGEAGILTDASYGEAVPDMKRTRVRLRRKIEPMLSKGVVPVVTGFIGQTSSGDMTTLGRGGSDYTATIVADSLGADEVWIWTDVDGIMTADPRLVKESRVLDSISYPEAEEMAFFGAKNMHPLALGPARLKKIPVRIKNGFKPELSGTKISDEEKRSSRVVKAVALVKNVGMITVSGESMVGRPGTAARVFGSLGEASINVLMISQSASELNMSIVVRRQALHRAAKVVSEALKRSGVDANILLDPEVSVLAAVGAGMRETPGVGSKILTAVSRAGVNVKMIVQGSTELNLSLVVREEDAENALSALHSAIIARR